MIKQTEVIIVRQGSKNTQYSLLEGETFGEGIIRVLKIYKNQICHLSSRKIDYIEA